METKKIYYQDPALKECDAVVLECRAEKKRFEIILDQTCFYPEGGGQPGDTGMLNDVRVFDTHIRDGQILHYTALPIEPGTPVRAVLDWDRRFDYMQQHSGEHMISGIINRLYHYDNKGFHMGADVTTIDFSGELAPDQIAGVEEQVNALICKNALVKCWFPDPEELKLIPYRSKKELAGDVRLVEFPEADICACCGVHIVRTGEIGLVKILSSEKFHGGTRMEIVCGLRAIKYLNEIFEQNKAISRQLSAKPKETAKAVSDLIEEHNKERLRIYELEEELFKKTASDCKDAGDCLVFFDRLTSDGVRRACDALQQTCGGRAAVFSGTDETGYKYAVGHPGADLSSFIKQMNAALNGRGGGKPAFAQGSVSARRADICRFFE